MEEVKIALQLEKDGYAYYKKAAELCPNEYGKKMFEKLAKDEIKHLETFRRLAQEIFGKVDEGEGRHLDIFEEIDFSTKAGEYAALDHAIKFEERAKKFFEDAAKKATDNRVKELFEKIAKEEEMHKQLLEAEKGYLQKSGVWFDYQEFRMDAL
ncbi:MAG: ferritin family protein [Thermoplasmata archaeon]|nr:ferritin family protein [Thermoplasmata archaeon]